MSGIECPQCNSLDQVRGVRAVYESQTSTYSGVTSGVASGVGFAPGVGVVSTVGRATYHTSGSSSSLLADQVAPPVYPHLARPGGGCLLAVMGALPVLAGLLTLPLLASGEPDAGRNALIFWCATGLPFAIVTGALLVTRVISHRRNKRAFQSYSAIHPSLLAVWEAAYLCQRCHLAFLPAGGFGAAGPRAVPVPQFRDLVADAAAELRAAPFGGGHSAVDHL